MYRIHIQFEDIFFGSNTLFYSLFYKNFLSKTDRELLLRIFEI